MFFVMLAFAMISTILAVFVFGWVGTFSGLTDKLDDNIFRARGLLATFAMVCLGSGYFLYRAWQNDKE